MKIFADLNQVAEINANSIDWVPSPLAGVERRMLDRDGEEVARATSLVRYAPGSHFSPHTHTGGEEYFVLEGVFSDESGHYPAGTYVRNPVGSSHQPYTKEGCVIWVKLQQMHPEDQSYVVLNTAQQAPLPSGNVTSLELHQFEPESVFMRQPALGQVYEEASTQGLEIFVVSGAIEIAGDIKPQHHWLRWPGKQCVSIRCTAGDTRLLIKQNHLELV